MEEGMSAFRYLQEQGIINLPSEKEQMQLYQQTTFQPENTVPDVNVNDVEMEMDKKEAVTEMEDEEPQQIIPKIQNVVSTANLGTRLNLKQIAMQARNAEYNPKRFAAVIMRIREPKTTALIFATGKMVCAGANSVEQSHKAARKFARIIQKMGFPVKFSHFKAQNLVGSCDVGFPIRLEKFGSDQPLFARYEPELFPGLIYRLADPKVVLLIFTSGKIVVTGAKHEEDLAVAMDKMLPLLEKYRKKKQILTRQ